jgi:hypothetical protein
MREGLRDSEITRLAALLRGGATYEEAAAAECADVSPEVLIAFKAHVLALAQEPGPTATLPVPRSAEDDREAMRRFFKTTETPRRLRARRAYRGGR